MISFALKDKSDYLNFGIVTTIFFGISAIAFIIGLENIASLAILGLVIFSFFLYGIIKYDKLWVYLIIIISPFYFYGMKPGVSINDIAFSVILNSFLYIWLIYILIFKRKKIVQSTSDFLILFFYFLSLALSLVSFLNEVTFIDWAREFSLYSVCLFYFPIKHYIKTDKEIKTLLILFAFAIFISDFYHFDLYRRTALADVIYAYQLGISVRLNQTLFTSAAFTGLIFAIYSKRLLHKILFLIFSFATISALVVTFSRTFWLILAFELVLAFLILPLNKKKTITLMALVLSTFFISISALVFRDKAEIFLKVAEKRLTSAGKGTQDESVRARFVEYSIALDEINQYPIAGNGIGDRVRIYDYFTLKTSYIANIHNTFLLLFHRWGYLVGSIFLIIILINTIKSFYYLRKAKADFYRILAYSSSASFLTLWISGFTSAQFFTRDSQFVIAFALFFVHIIQEHLKNKTSNEN